MNCILFKMAKLWMFFCLFLACTVKFSYGMIEKRPEMQHEPLLDYAGNEKLGLTNGMSTELKLDFNISYFGASYNSLHISKGGFISFVPNVNFIEDVQWAEGIRNPKADRPFLAPFYHEPYEPQFDYGGNAYYKLIYADQLNSGDDKEREIIEYFSKYVKEAVIDAPKEFNAKLVAVITWQDVTDRPTGRKGNCKRAASSECKSATFQAVLIADKKNTFAIFNYLKMEIPFLSSYQAGFNGGYGRGWFNVIPCHGACSVSLNISRVNDLPKLKGSDLKGRYILSVGGEEIVRGGCLPQSLQAGMLEVHPHQVGMFGGEKLEVSGKCLSSSSKIYCKFGSSADSPVTEGVMTNSMKGHCPVPRMTMRGPILLHWSSDGNEWTADKHIHIVLPDQVEEPVLVADQDKQAWYTRDASSITVNWSPERLSTNSRASVEIKLVGYRETESKVEYKDLEIFGDVFNSEGRYTVDTAFHACKKNCQDFDMGLLEVDLKKNYYGDATDRVAIRFGPIPLGWYVNEKLTEDVGEDWSDKMCERWYEKDKQQNDWWNEIPLCPCNLNQVLADFGRWQADVESCNMFVANSQCRFHKKAKHCVRSVQATSSGAGNQCCYSTEGTLLLSQFSNEGSTPDRGHPWGAPPFNAPDKVPSLSHWKHDVVPFFHCCVWTKFDFDKCRRYMNLRPTTDCDDYEVPGLALVRGDTHITTFDSQTYTFGGRGDFTLLEKDNIIIQGKFESRRGSWDLGKLGNADKKSWKPTALTSVAIQGSGQIVEVHPAPANAIIPRGLDIIIGRSRHFFFDNPTKWQDFSANGDLSIVNNALSMKNNRHDNFTIFTNGVGINVLVVNNLLHVTVAIPPSMKLKSNSAEGAGLFGMFDGEFGNDFVSKGSNSIISQGNNPERIYDFAKTWAVSREDSLFPFGEDPNDDSLKDYTPFYRYDEIPHVFVDAPTDTMISSTCEENYNCKWDYRITGSRQVAMATKEADERFTYSQGSAYLVESCGILEIGDMAILSSYNFSVTREVAVTGCDADTSFDGEAKFSCVRERLEDAKDESRDDYGRKVVDNQIEYIIHWVPEPYTVCGGESSSEASLGLIIGIAVGALVVIVVIVVVVVICCKRKKSFAVKKDKPRPADRVRTDRDVYDGTAEPMMTSDKRPVYKGDRRDQGASSAV